MSMTGFWLGLFLLGAYHGVNPAMGWLFAVALGLQEKNGRAVLRSLLPLGAGHVISVGAVVAAVELARAALPLGAVRVGCAGFLVSFGLFRLARRRHPRWVGMRVGSRDLALWSFLMATAHGAGLMLVPFLFVSLQSSVQGAHMHSMAMASSIPTARGMSPLMWWMPVGTHTLGYLLATGVIAAVVYHKLGVSILQRAWFNLEVLWAGALMAAGALVLVL